MEVGKKKTERCYTQWKQELCLKMSGICEQHILLPVQKTRMMTQKIEFFILFFSSIGEA